MKKLIALALCFLLLLSSCGSGSGSTYVIESYDEESRITISVNSTEENSASISAPSEEPSFLVKEKRFTCEEGDLMLLEITNESSGNFDITLHGTYYDASGEIITTEIQSFEGFPAGYQNFFLFDPSTSFAEFSYDLEATPCTGAVYAHEIGAMLTGTDEKDTIDGEKAMAGDFTRYPTLFANFTVKNESDKELLATFFLVLYNEKNEIVERFSYSPLLPANTPFHQEFKSWTLYRLQEGETQFPEKFGGELRAVVGVQRVEPYGGR